MIVKIESPKGDLAIVLFLRESPLACRILQQQINLKDWANPCFSEISPSHAVLTCKKTVGMSVPKNPRRLQCEAGTVAYAKDSNTDLVICRSKDPSVPIGAIVGRLTPKSFANLNAQLDGKRRKLEPYEPPSKAEVKPPSNVKSDQLIEVIKFQQRLETYRKSLAS